MRMKRISAAIAVAIVFAFGAAALGANTATAGTTWPWGSDTGTVTQLPPGATPVSVSDGGYGWVYCGGIDQQCLLHLILPDNLAARTFTVSVADVLRQPLLTARGVTDLAYGTGGAVPGTISLSSDGKSLIIGTSWLGSADWSTHPGGTAGTNIWTSDHRNLISLGIDVVSPPTSPSCPPDPAHYVGTVQAGKTLNVTLADLLQGTGWTDTFIVQPSPLSSAGNLAVNPDGSFSWAPSAPGTFTFAHTPTIPGCVDHEIAGTITVTPAAQVPAPPLTPTPAPAPAPVPATHLPVVSG